VNGDKLDCGGIRLDCGVNGDGVVCGGKRDEDGSGPPI